MLIVYATAFTKGVAAVVLTAGAFAISVNFVDGVPALAGFVSLAGFV
ncbi:hypothetical protein CAXC1_330099 [Candidatus Xenohaliotis californiensis]|uniref:Uncharacterized protein n=1 Tax=Candidatus Xenohaliotis californiensis TaxID=84677 RepID=A0ABM9N8R8_9RICK|nr:hypothetical protein CAXC1_330099 [Candidatus Xenohaliotis californiensis]